MPLARRPSATRRAPSPFELPLLAPLQQRPPSSSGRSSRSRPPTWRLTPSVISTRRARASPRRRSSTWLAGTRPSLSSLPPTRLFPRSSTFDPRLPFPLLLDHAHLDPPRSRWRRARDRCARRRCVPSFPLSLLVVVRRAPLLTRCLFHPSSPPSFPCVRPTRRLRRRRHGRRQGRGPQEEREGAQGQP